MCVANCRTPNRIQDINNCSLNIGFFIFGTKFKFKLLLSSNKILNLPSLKQKPKAEIVRQNTGKRPAIDA